MHKDSFIHFSFWFAFFVLVSILTGNVSLSYWPFWVGGIIGTFLPDLDHIIYVLFLNPQDLTSQRFNYLVKKKDIKRAGALLHETSSERKEMVFHTFFFQIVFFVFTLLIISSTSSVFVYGIVLSFSLHFLVDQFIDITDTKNLDNWGKLFSAYMDKKQATFYLTTMFLLLLLMGLML